MKLLTILGVFVCVCLLAIIIWLLWWNRSSGAIWSKVIPAFVIGLIGAFFAILFGTISESIDIKFGYTLYFNKVNKKPLDEHYTKQHAFGGAQFDINLRNFINKKLSEKKLDIIDFNKEGDKVKDFYFDLTFVKLFSRFYWVYADWWDININSVRRGNSFETSVYANKPIPSCKSIEWNDLLSKLDSNDSLGELLGGFSEKSRAKEMKVPPKTKIKIDTSKYEKKITLANPFVEITIKFNNSGGAMGLGDFQWLLNYDNKKNDDFWSEHFEVVCEAKFEKLRSGHPEMPKYKKWVQTMFEEIQYQFDNKKRLIRARNYRDLSN